MYASRRASPLARFVLRMVEEVFALHAVSIANHAKSGTLDIEWDDGQQQRLTHGLLRVRCQCADCKVTPPQQALPGATALRLVEIRPVGTYGAQLIFSDGHDRGIYPWAYLYKLGLSDR